MKKKKISLEELKIQSFTTSFDDEKQTLHYQGGGSEPTPHSGPCTMCIDSFFCNSTACEDPSTTITTCNVTKMNTSVVGCCG